MAAIARPIPQDDVYRRPAEEVVAVLRGDAGRGLTAAEARVNG